MTNTEQEAKFHSLIQQMTEEIHRLFEIPTINACTDLESMVKKLGGKPITTGIKEPAVYKTSDTSFCIELPYKLDEHQKTWETAVCLGDLFLHMGYTTNPAKWNKQTLHAPYKYHDPEKQNLTNLFAGYLLMPTAIFDELIQTYTEKNGRINTAKIAKHFGVSVSIAHFWGVKIKRFQPDF